MQNNLNIPFLIQCCDSQVSSSDEVCVCAAGEEWLVIKVGAYLPGAHEEVLDIVNAFILTDKVGEEIRPEEDEF